MQGWKEGVIPAGKGTREPRSSKNQAQKVDQDGERHLVILQGGDPGSVTHGPVPRRGSRPRSGGFRETKAEAQAKVAQGEIREWHRAANEDEGAQVIDLAAIKGQAENEKPHIWTDQDFTPEALAAQDRQHASRATNSEQRLDRGSLEAAAVRYQKNRLKPKPPRATRSECVSRIDLRDQDEPITSIRKRPELKSSHR